MKKTMLALILFTLNLLCACSTPISREQFNRDLVQVTNDNEQLYKYFRKPAKDSAEKQSALKEILSDEDIVTGIYDYAVSNHQASSVDTIISTDWARTFRRKGMLFLSDDDKKLFLEKLGMKLAEVPAGQCVQFMQRNNKEILDIPLAGIDRTKAIKIGPITQT